MNRRISTLATMAIAIVAVIAGMLLSRALLQRAESSQSTTALVTGTLFEPPRALAPIALIDHDGRPFDNASLQGAWTFLFFGFTNCPDVCPMTMRILAQVEQRLSDLPDAQRPRVVLVSVDPKRDTPEQLAKYVKYFNPAFLGVTGEQSSLDEFTRKIGVPVAISETGDGGYTVDHSAAIFLIDPRGRIRALFSAPHVADSIAADYRRVVGITDTKSDG